MGGPGGRRTGAGGHDCPNALPHRVTRYLRAGNGSRGCERRECARQGFGGIRFESHVLAYQEGALITSADRITYAVSKADGMGIQPDFAPLPPEGAGAAHRLRPVHGGRDRGRAHGGGQDVSSTHGAGPVDRRGAGGGGSPPAWPNIRSAARSSRPLRPPICRRQAPAGPGRSACEAAGPRIPRCVSCGEGGAGRRPSPTGDFTHNHRIRG